MLKKLFPYTLLILFFSLFSCDKSNDEPIEDPDKPGVEEPKATVDLSEDEMANCYIVHSPGKYKFKADNQFNLGEGLPVPLEISPVGAELVWQTVKGSVSNISLDLEDGVPYVSFDVNLARGNALIAVLNEQDEIEWSWHIWMPAEEVMIIAADSGYEVMNMNLGAVNNVPGDAGSYGMLYQWGRKDPFPASASLTGDTSTISAPMYNEAGSYVFITNSSWTDNSNNTLAYAIANPTVCLSNYAHYATSHDWLAPEYADDSLWGNPEGDIKDELNLFPNKGAKTCYDPCPAGWRVPPADVFNYLTPSGGYEWTFEGFNVADTSGDGDIDLDDYEFGWQFYVNNNTPSYFPAAARFDGSYAMLMGSMSGLWGNYWGNAPYSSQNGYGFCVLAFQVKDMYGNESVSVSPAAGGSKADAYSIRPIRDNK